MNMASERPSNRARLRCSGGSLSDRIEMKITLSIPSTISNAVSVSNATHTSGLLNSSKQDLPLPLFLY